MRKWIASVLVLAMLWEAVPALALEMTDENEICDSGIPGESCPEEIIPPLENESPEEIQEDFPDPVQPAVLKAEDFVPEEIPVDNDHFPDPEFRRFLLEEVNQDGTQTLSPQECSVTILNLDQRNIASLQGISCFPKLQSLSCNDNQLTELVLPDLPELKKLSCFQNPLRHLDVAGAPQLTSLQTSGGELCCLNLTGLNEMVHCRIEAENRAVSILTVKGTDLDENFCPQAVIEVTGGGYDAETGTFFFEDGSRNITYGYDCGAGQTASFCLEYTGVGVSFQEIPEKSPDCETEGKKAYILGGDGNPYEIRDGHHFPVPQESLTLPPLGHSWSAPEFKWDPAGGSCTASVTCQRNGAHQDRENGTIQKSVTLPPTYTEMGETTYQAQFTKDWAKDCAVPSLTLKDIPVKAHAHVGKKVEGKDATETEEGRKTYYCCSLCGKNFEDPECSREIADLPAWVRIPKLTHVHTLQYRPGYPATESTVGRRPYYHCPLCGKDFADGAGTQVINNLQDWIVIPAGHKMIYFPKIAPSCEMDGRRESWFCTRCGKLFSDADGKKEMQTRGLSALGHDWQLTYHWEGDWCWAERTCTRDSSHHESTQVKALAYVTQLPTCEEMGKTTYLAVFPEEWAGAQVRCLQDVPALGHEWEEPVYSWSEDGKTCVADRICRRDPEHIQEETAEAEEGMARFRAEWARSQASPGPAAEEAAVLLPGMDPLILTASQLKTLSDDSGLTLYCAMAGIHWNPEAVRWLSRQVQKGETLRIAVRRLDGKKDLLTDRQQALLDQKPEARLYALVLEKESQGQVVPIPAIPQGKTHVTVPFSLEAGDRLEAWEPGEGSTLQPLSCGYAPEDSTAGIDLGSSGLFLLEAEGSSRASWLLWCLGGAALLALLAGGSYLALRKKKA